MPASLPGSTLAQNKANPSLGAFVIFDPLSGPKGSPLDKDLATANQCSTGALSTGIGFGDTDIISINNGADVAQANNSSASIFARGFGYHNIAGEKNAAYTAPPPNGVVATNTVDSTIMYIGGGKCTATANGVAPAVPYTAGVALAGGGNGGSRDGGAGPAFSGFAMRMVTASAGVAVGAAIETGFINRSPRSLVSGESAYGSSTTQFAAAS